MMARRGRDGAPRDESPPILEISGDAGGRRILICHQTTLNRCAFARVGAGPFSA
jgi:hypothetical protein